VPQCFANSTEKSLVGDEPVYVGGREFPDGVSTSLCVVPEGERSAVLERAPQVRVDDLNAVAATAQSQLFDHERVEEADEVRTRTDQVRLIFERLLECAGTAQALCTLEDDHLESRARQVRGRSETVVATAHDSDVPLPSA
jgi:hypothetical protein